MRALNQQGETFDLDAEGLLAVCIQHEIDHLDGKVFVEYLSSSSRPASRASWPRKPGSPPDESRLRRNPEFAAIGPGGDLAAGFEVPSS